VQIGSLADWVSGLATAGSLVLGFSILLRDRSKADQEEATQVVTWFVNHPDNTLELFVTNGGSRPTVNVALCLASLDEQQKQAALWRIRNIMSVLAPGEGTSLKIPFEEFHANILYPSYIQFRDANGMSWRRNIRSGKLRRTGAGFNPRQQFKLARSPHKLITQMKIKYRCR
jgi:hypothetical protein